MQGWPYQLKVVQNLPALPQVLLVLLLTKNITSYYQTQL